jgi:hypothetical protein
MAMLVARFEEMAAWDGVAVLVGVFVFAQWWGYGFFCWLLFFWIF